MIPQRRKGAVIRLCFLFDLGLPKQKHDTITAPFRDRVYACTSEAKVGVLGCRQARFGTFMLRYVECMSRYVLPR